MVPTDLCVHQMNRLGLCRRPAPDRSGWGDAPTREECDRLKGHPGHHAYRRVRLGAHPGPCSDGLPPDAMGPFTLPTPPTETADDRTVHFGLLGPG